MQTNQRHFSSRIEIQFIFGTYIRLILKFRQLPGSLHNRAFHKIGGHDLCIAMLACMQIKHERDQSAFELRSTAFEDGEAAATDLAASFKVDKMQAFTEVPVRLGFKMKCYWLAPAVFLALIVTPLPPVTPPIRHFFQPQYN